MSQLSCLDEQFERLAARWHEMLEAVPPEKLYWQPRQSSGAFPVYSCGEHLLRSAASVEQTFGGLTVNLWDDPFEWTLPETLDTHERIAEYFREVEATRRRGFLLFEDDAALLKDIVVPSGERQALGTLLVETLVRAVHHEGRAYATLRLFSDARLPAL
jgi:hypothetical protein